MYEYRSLTPEQQQKIVQERIDRGFPPHSPPHLIRDQTTYLLTATCYEHKPHLHQPDRRQQVLNSWFEQGSDRNIELRAWVILPNHYHLLVEVKDFNDVGRVFGRIHGSTSHQWNLDDKVTKRKIWYRYSDRAIRSERHYYTTLNYIHYNPVKHGWAESPYDWAESSVHWYLSDRGRDWLRDAWVNYPVKDYGKDWDKF